MVEELRTFMKRLLPSVEGLECIIISDRDGVSLVEVHVGGVPSGTMKPPFLATFSIASEQASKLGMSKNRSIVSYYSGHQVVQFNHLPLVVTFVAQADANTGMIYSLEEDLQDAVSDLKAAVNVP